MQTQANGTVTTPILRRGRWGIFRKRPVLQSRSKRIVLCLGNVKRLWNLPLGAKRFWIEAGLVPRHDDETVRGRIRRSKNSGLEWSRPGGVYLPFYNHQGLTILAEKLGIKSGAKATVYVRLLYE